MWKNDLHAPRTPPVDSRRPAPERITFADTGWEGDLAGDGSPVFGA